MATETYDSSTSGYLTDSFEGISRDFTDISIISVSETNVVAKGMRYGRWWLLKALSPEVSGQEHYRQRLRKEFEITMQLQHPLVVSSFGLETVPSLGTCIVMEYVDGVSLEAWLSGGPSLRDRRRVALDILDAMDYVHSKGIVHRDLKPSNIVITRNGNGVKIIDFGLSDTDSHAVLKQPAGTPRYMSPEQRAERRPDVRNDIFSLGKVFEVMDLRWRSQVKRCMNPIESRYKTVSDLKKAIKGRKRNFNIRIAVGMTMVFGAYLALLFMIRPAADGESAPVSRDMTAVAETVAAPVAPVPIKTEAVPEAENPQSLIAAADVSPSQSPADTRRKAELDRVIKEGESRMENLFRTSPIKNHLDTLSHYRYYREELEFADNDFENFPQKYCAGLGNKFSEQEKEEILAALTKRSKALENEKNSKFQKLIDQHKY